jgi:hypothetical protein
MTKEREVLLEALEWMHELRYVWENSRDSGDYDLLDLIAGINKIEKLLAQPETVVWKETLIEHLQSAFDSEMLQTEEGDALIRLEDAICYVEEYAPPKREPLSDELLEECLYLIVAFEEGCDYALYSNETGNAIELLRQKLGGFHASDK